MAKGKRRNRSRSSSPRGTAAQQKAAPPKQVPADEERGVPAASTESAGKRRYLLDKLNRLSKRPERREEMIALLEGLWPASDPVSRAERWLYLLRVLPEHAENELSHGPPLAEGALVTVSEAVLGLSEEQVSVLAAAAGMPPTWAREVEAARAASRLIAQGDDATAAEHLRRIGLSSPLRRVRLFLRGLSAYYQADDAQAVRALQSIPEGSPLHPAASRLLASCGVSSADASPLGQSALSRVGEAVQAGRPNAALAEAARCREDLSPVAVEALGRDLTSALLQGGIPPGTAVDRVCRALPTLSDPFRRSHLTALAVRGAGAAGGPPGDLERCWVRLEHHLARGSGDFAEADRAIAQAAVLAKRGEQMLRRIEDDEERWQRPWDWDEDDFLYDDDTEDYEDLARLLERAVTLDPSEPKHWQALIRAYDDADEPQKRNRTVDRMAEALPDSAEAMTTAARAAAKRGAWDKALRYARRASALEPLARAARDLEASLLIGKARKKAPRGRGAAAECYQTALDVPHRTRRSQMKTAAEAAAFHRHHQLPDRAEALREQALASDPRPWLWAAEFLAGVEHVEQSHGGRRRGARASSRRGVPAVSLPTDWEPASDPEASELATVVELATAAWEADHRTRTPLHELAMRGIVAGVGTVTDANLLSQCLQLAGDNPEVGLAAAEQGCRIDPSSAAFLAARYDHAVSASRPPEYFQLAEQELDRAIEAQRERFDEDGPAGPHSALDLLARFGFEAPWARLARVRERVRRYLKRSGLSRPARSKRRGRTRNPRQTEIPF